MKNKNGFVILPDKDDDWYPKHADQHTYLPKRPMTFQLDVGTKKNRPVSVPAERIAYTQPGLRRRTARAKLQGNGLFSLTDLKDAGSALDTTPTKPEDELGLDRFVLEPRPKQYRLRPTCCGGGSKRPPDTPSTQYALTPKYTNDGDESDLNLHPFFTNSILRLEDMSRRVKVNATTRVTNLCHSHDVDVFVINYARNHTDWSFLKAQPDTTSRIQNHPDYTKVLSFDKISVTKRFVADAGGPRRMPWQGLGIVLTAPGKLTSQVRESLAQVALEHGASRVRAKAVNDRNVPAEWSDLHNGSLIDNTTKGAVIAAAPNTQPSPASLGDTQHELLFVNRTTGKGRNLLVGWLRNSMQMEMQRRLQRKKNARAGTTGKV